MPSSEEVVPDGSLFVFWKSSGNPAKILPPTIWPKPSFSTACISWVKHWLVLTGRQSTVLFSLMMQSLTQPSQVLCTVSSQSHMVYQASKWHLARQDLIPKQICQQTYSLTRSVMFVWKPWEETFFHRDELETLVQADVTLLLVVSVATSFAFHATYHMKQSVWIETGMRVIALITPTMWESDQPLVITTLSVSDLGDRFFGIMRRFMVS